MRLVRVSDLKSEPLPEDHTATLGELTTAIRAARVQAARAVNSELVTLYWRIGRIIVDRQQKQGWGAKVIDRLAVDLRTEFPGLRGLSARSLVYMRTLAAANRRPIAQQPAAQLGWGHVMTLLDRSQPATRRPGDHTDLDDPQRRCGSICRRLTTIFDAAPCYGSALPTRWPRRPMRPQAATVRHLPTPTC